MTPARSTLEFTNDWFERSARKVWEAALPHLDHQPRRVLEIGSFEGRATCFLLQWAQEPLEIHCIDTWEGSPEFAGFDMVEVEKRFRRNVTSCLGMLHRIETYKGRSSEALPYLHKNYRGYFDFIYIDGSHLACDVLTDAVMSFPLLRPRGVMAFDDYLWCQDRSALETPKLAIDSFVNCFRGQMHVCFSSNDQVWLQRI